MKQWLGPSYNWPGFFPISSNYRTIINKNIERQYKLHTSDVGSGVYIYLSCPKQNQECSPSTIAASADQHRVFWINHVTIFCPLFFTKDTMTTSLARVRGSVGEQQIMENY